MTTRTPQPAFPTIGLNYGFAPDDNRAGVPCSGGMSDRAVIAMHLMAGILANNETSIWSDDDRPCWTGSKETCRERRGPQLVALAKDAVDAADALLAELDK